MASETVGTPIEDAPEAAKQLRVLVAVMNSLRDFEIARDRGWYRIPVKRAPPQIGADCLAFYHTAVFAEEKWSIRYYAPIRGYRVVTRANLLPDEPDHPRAGDRYYRVDIGPLQLLPRPVPSRNLRRVTFISTTLSRLLTSDEIQDLWETRSSEENLWMAFCNAETVDEGSYQISEERNLYRTRSEGGTPAGQATVVLHGGLPTAVPGWFALYFAPRRRCDGSPSCLDLVRDAMAVNSRPRARWRRAWPRSRRPAR